METTTRSGWRTWTYLAAMVAGLATAAPARAQECARTITANVAALDHVIVYNRMGAQNVNGMLYALTRDLVPNTCTGAGPCPPFVLRADKRPRPLVLRVSAGECLQVTLSNYLTPAANPGQCGACCGGWSMPCASIVNARAAAKTPSAISRCGTSCASGALF
ncbi:MAG TPA: hypothetical protein VFI16_05110 [Anaeromyxobacteraceae bacterium]|nr:hypothetical protein [Anaeromyxobacteraceae bacterium]